MAENGRTDRVGERLRRAALEIAELGYPVLPLPSVRRGRRRAGECICELSNADCRQPSTRCQYFGIDRATSNRDHIERWWQTHPHARIGMALGADARLVALLIDGRDGLASANELEIMHGMLPKTPTILASSDRLVHLFSADPSAMPAGSTPIAPGITLLGEGEVVFAPPSVHLYGDRWEESSWDPGATIRQTSVAPVPGWILRRCNLRVRTRTENKAQTEMGEEMPDLPFRTGFDVAADNSSIWINEPWAATQAITLLHGTEKGSGRTTFALHLIRSVLEGSEFLTRRSVQGSVVLLTSESPASLGRAILARGYNHLFLNRLHVLHYQESLDVSWPKLIAAAVDRCTTVKARLIVIDRLNAFAGREVMDGSRQVDADYVMQPLLKAILRGVGLFAVWDLPSDNTSQGRIPDTPLDPFVDIKVHLEQVGDHTRERVLLTKSRFDETPRKSLIVLQRHGFEYRFDQPGLFQDAQGSALTSGSEPDGEGASTSEDQMPLFPGNDVQ